MEPDQLSGLDGVFLFLESENTPMHVGGVSIYDPSTSPLGDVGRDEIVSVVAERAHLAKPFRKKLVRLPLDLDYPYWVDDADFDVEDHVRTITVPAPGDWAAFCAVVSDVIAEPMDLTRPLWEFVLIDGLQLAEQGIPDGCFAIVSKAHHAAIDGASGVDITAATHTLGPNDELANPAPHWEPAPGPSLGSRLVRAQVNAIRQPIRAANAARKLAPGLAKAAAATATGKAPAPELNPPKTRFNGSVRPGRSFGAVTIPLDDVKGFRKRIAGADNGDGDGTINTVTINDVVLAIVGGALRRHLGDELPADALTAMTPIAVPSSRDANETGNSVANMTVSLATDVEEPLEQLREIHAAASAAKSLTATIGASEMAESTKTSPALVAGPLFKITTAIGATLAAPTTATTTVTNVPGPAIPIYFAGAELVAQYNFAPLHHGMGLVHTVYSYRGQLTIAFNADASMLPDPRSYEADLMAASDELLTE